MLKGDITYLRVTDIFENGFHTDKHRLRAMLMPYGLIICGLPTSYHIREHQFWKSIQFEWLNQRWSISYPERKIGSWNPSGPPKFYFHLDVVLPLTSFFRCMSKQHQEYAWLPNSQDPYMCQLSASARHPSFVYESWISNFSRHRMYFNETNKTSMVHDTKANEPHAVTASWKCWSLHND